MSERVAVPSVERDEVLPLRPDLLVYYEGADQFDLRTVVSELPYSAGMALAAGEHCPAHPAGGGPAEASGGWLASLEGESALVRRVQVGTRILPVAHASRRSLSLPRGTREATSSA
jgi:hypothetical protein